MKVDKVVVVVFDGLRPDMIAGRMPNLEAFARDGLWFRDARSVFPSYTRVCTTSFATGAWPAQHGIVGNAFHMPQLVRGGPLDTSNFDHLAALRARDGRVVTTDSLGEALARSGKRMAVVHCGSAGSAFLVNHNVAENGHWTFSVHGETATQTPRAVRQAVAQIGPLPEMEIPRFDVVDYAGRVVRELALDEDQADVTLLWLPEPDTSFHYRQLGSEATRAVMASADKVFAEIVSQIRSGPFTDTTAIVAMSDHGQITTSEELNIGAAMSGDGLTASLRPDDGTLIALTCGAMGEARMLSRDKGVCAATADWLLAHPQVGLVFARDDLAGGLAGTLPMSLVHHSHTRAAELYYVMRSDDGPDAFGLLGRGGFTGGVPLGGGMHGGLNRHEMNTTLIWNVPGGRKGHEHCPASLIDIAPTVAALLGLDWQSIGRTLPVLIPDIAEPTEEIIEQCHAGRTRRIVRQHLDGRIYLDHGGLIQ